ncbi:MULTISPECIES: hypothetical protein [unclassified Acinetobacter]|nr:MULTISPECIES: hypothetical protein [unclassified Acinetobacter]WOE32206.1 hypothetical protein QSG84_03045 [Acinetobacter sp. SAAs470]WOE37676.1 hypothetical protein QSG86_12090 [Acinetobacter sp. SAAs474]
MIRFKKSKKNKKAPLILLGMIAKCGTLGQIGAGVAMLSDEIFAIEE